MGFIKRVAVFGIGGIVGSGIGAAVASFLAPQSGQQLQQSVTDLIGEAKVAGEQAQAETEARLKQRFREQVNDPAAFTGANSKEAIDA
jgi:gas vesicle protein